MVVTREPLEMIYLNKKGKREANKNIACILDIKRIATMTTMQYIGMSQWPLSVMFQETNNTTLNMICSVTNSNCVASY